MYMNVRDMRSHTPVEPLPHDPYIDAVIDALEAAGLLPTQWWTSVSDEYDTDDGLLPSAVLIWNETHPAVNADEFEHGIGVYWNSEAGWECARQQPNGANDIPDHLGVDLWAAPERVVTTVRNFLDLVEEMRESAGEWDGAKDVAAAVEVWRSQD